MDGTTTTARARLRAELTKYRERSRFGKYPKKLRIEGEKYARQRRAQGASVREIAAELAVREDTVKGWAASNSSTAVAAREQVAPLTEVSLVPVRVKAQAQPAERWGRLEVEFADGTRLVASGVGTHALADAIEALRRSR